MMNESNVKLINYVYSSEKVTEQRRSANYKPNIWKFDFLRSLASNYDEEEFEQQLKKGVIEVKGIFVKEMGVMQKLELIDWIQKLGLANHFHKEINEFLETIHVSVKNNQNPSIQENLHTSALCFRLLRQHGYEIRPDILGNFFDEKGMVISREDPFACDAKISIVEFVEASHLGLEGEHIMDVAKSFEINSFLDIFNTNQLSSLLVERVVHSLELPSHWRVPWFDIKWHVKQYQKEKHLHPILLDLAKLNFNIIQAKLQKEVKDLSRWWENIGIKKELSFARNRLVESFMCATGVAYEPKYKSARKWLTKVISFILVIDDIYDVHASFEELKPFTMAFERWDEKDFEELPEYMRICFHALKDVTSETAYEIGGEKNFHKVLPYLKKAWIDFFKALHVEAKWYREGYIPSLEEYLSNGWISSSGPVILLHSHFATMHEIITDEIENFLHKYEDLVNNVSLIIRLCNDLGTTMAEKERGDVASSIVCYMKEMNVTEEEARKHIQEMINNAWKRINGLCSTRVASVDPFVTQAQNAARVAHTLYQNGDGFGIQDKDIKKHIISLLIEPL